MAEELTRNPEAHAETQPGATSPAVDRLDPAQQSLADALRVSFGILKIVMVLLLVGFCFSGVFSVPEQQAAVRLRFGDVVTLDEETGQQVIRSGNLHFAMPYPIEEVIFVNATTQQLELDKEFWFEVPPGATNLTQEEMIERASAGPLDPDRSGSLLTADANVVHLQASVKYRIRRDTGNNLSDAAVVQYISNVRDEEQAARIVRAAVSEAIVKVVAMQPADDLVRGQILRDEIAQRAQRTLDAAETGLEIEDVSIPRVVPPLSVRAAFREVNNAESSKARQIEQARKVRSEILGEVAGQHADILWETLIRPYESAIDRVAESEGEPSPELQQEVQRYETLLAEAFEQLKFRVNAEGEPVRLTTDEGQTRAIDPEVDGDVREFEIVGQVAQIINQAQTYRTGTVARLRAEAEGFVNLLAAWEKAPTIAEVRQWEDVRQALFGSQSNEQIIVPEGQVYLELNRDPQAKRARDRALLEDGGDGG